jgi:hypothetical protein
MYKFSAEFETIKELADFVNGIQGGVPAAASVDVTPTATLKPRAKKEKEAPAILTAAAPEAPYVAPVAEVKAPVVEAPVVAQAVQQDSAVMIEEVKSIVGGMKSTGTADDSLKAMFSGIYAQLGLPAGTPVSKLENEQITRFLMVLKEQAAKQQNSFI